MRWYSRIHARLFPNEYIIRMTIIVTQISQSWALCTTCAKPTNRSSTMTSLCRITRFNDRLDLHLWRRCGCYYIDERAVLFTMRWLPQFALFFCPLHVLLCCCCHDIIDSKQWWHFSSHFTMWRIAYNECQPWIPCKHHVGALIFTFYSGRNSRTRRTSGTNGIFMRLMNGKNCNATWVWNCPNCMIPKKLLCK